ncbi:uncharacterized protein BDCG_17851 [Blastomyces dermatitidis ER-3]|uniref:Uncharacterized protein n=1 Tax=Ajellomyces dermatitidis (strain ER-3 / ATCC MYA-2586) TaxID=559297 RepID=A0ABX2W0N2_AJEDR|nr:uncharacterized protein BDCG_17851 [Blastomyces dermatitidis ER-3]OAT02947.1 hypothetical protein BDCG_17851 [Blastomyces dermatitidis ER-3]
MSNDNMKLLNMSIDAVPQWLRAMLKLQSQQETHAISISTELNTKALKEHLDASAYFNASDLTLYSS